MLLHVQVSNNTDLMEIKTLQVRTRRIGTNITINGELKYQYHFNGSTLFLKKIRPNYRLH